MTAAATATAVTTSTVRFCQFHRQQATVRRVCADQAPREHPIGQSRLRRLVHSWARDEKQPVDYESVRQRFPWIGLGGGDGVSGRYRELMAEAHRDREVVEAIDSVRHSA